MNRMGRRRFLAGAAVAAAAPAQVGMSEPAAARDAASAIDFRYAPLSGQATICFPDDRYKSLIGERGELRYGHPGQGRPIDYFPVIVEFSLAGMERDSIAWQRLEGPGIPIIHTRIDRPAAILELTAFATNRRGEGRVDNVILEVRPRTAGRVRATPALVLKTRQAVAAARVDGAGVIQLGDGDAAPFLVADSSVSRRDTGGAWALGLPQEEARADRPLRRFLRFPQEGQSLERVRAGLAEPDSLLAEAREYWRGWKAFGGEVAWDFPGRHGEFLTACARNILQAREVRDGRITFQVGPTVYRGLWVVDGHFILEAARYLGYDAEAQQGLETTWARQQSDGAIIAGGGREHWKDTGIAMFTLVRQAELGQDWSYFRKMQPEILRAASFLKSLRDRARAGESACGRYGLLAPGFGDGGLGGVRDEFTNTLWALAGLHAVAEAAERQGVGGFEPVKTFHDELRAALSAAVVQETRRHPAGFDYLPMLMKSDAQWGARDEWDRPRPQVAQWALSHAIYPGLLFRPEDPVVRGHIALMQDCTQEDVPAETGWIPHEGLWNYNAAFVAHMYLWAGLADWARLTFHGFLNHATRLYAWREEQPLRGSAVAGYVGDMPHNWASAECVLYLRHMLALEDGRDLRLLAGIGAPELSGGDPYTLAESPTRFGRVSLSLEPAGAGRDWRLRFRRGKGDAPGTVRLPRTLLPGIGPAAITGASAKMDGSWMLVDPGAVSWEAVWRP